MLPYVEVGRHARLRDVVVDSRVRIPEGLVVGEDPEEDARRFAPGGVDQRPDQGVERDADEAAADDAAAHVDLVRGHGCHLAGGPREGGAAPLARRPCPS